MERVTTEKAIHMLRAKGMEITEDQAILILSFMRKLANATVEGYLLRYQSVNPPKKVCYN